MQRLSEIINCLESRQKWYEKAIDMQCGGVEWDNHFDWPPSMNNPHRDPASICEWRAAVRELKNTIDMLKTV